MAFFVLLVPALKFNSRAKGEEVGNACEDFWHFISGFKARYYNNACKGVRVCKEAQEMCHLAQASGHCSKGSLFG